MTTSLALSTRYKRPQKYSKFLTVPLFNLKKHRYYFYHDTYVDKLSKDWVIDLVIDDYIVMAHINDHMVGVQFHPEHYNASAAPFYHAWIQYLTKKS
jgi:imidazoleglycerol phosphate synthase glutamine amidotransferase subunit HisH